MEYVAIITGLVLLQTVWFAIQVGTARGKYDCPAPATSGAPEFERANRVHMNTIEQLVILLPALWMFAYYVRPDVAAGLGLVFLIGRQIYRSAYLGDPSKRSAGFSIGMLAMLALLVGSIVGAGMKLL